MSLLTAITARPAVNTYCHYCTTCSHYLLPLLLIRLSLLTLITYCHYCTACCYCCTGSSHSGAVGKRVALAIQIWQVRAQARSSCLLICSHVSLWATRWVWCLSLTTKGKENVTFSCFDSLSRGKYWDSRPCSKSILLYLMYNVTCHSWEEPACNSGALEIGIILLAQVTLDFICNDLLRKFIFNFW